MSQKIPQERWHLHKHWRRWGCDHDHSRQREQPLREHGDWHIPGVPFVVLFFSLYTLSIPMDYYQQVRSSLPDLYLYYKCHISNFQLDISTWVFSEYLKPNIFFPLKHRVPPACLFLCYKYPLGDQRQKPRHPCTFILFPFCPHLICFSISHELMRNCFVLAFVLQPVMVRLISALTAYWFFSLFLSTSPLLQSKHVIRLH